jgi:hypothetical protein
VDSRYLTHLDGFPSGVRKAILEADRHRAAASAELCRTSKRTKSYLFTTVRRVRELKDAVRLQLPGRNVADAAIPQRQSLPQLR